MSFTLANIFYTGTQYIPLLNSSMGGARSPLAERRPTPCPVDNWSDLWITVGKRAGLALPSALPCDPAPLHLIARDSPIH
jgi:hypothetical protein